MMPPGLVTISRAFQFDLDATSPLVELQDRCMQAVLNACQKNQWEVTGSCKAELSQLTDGQGKSLLMRAIELKDDRMVEEFVGRDISLHVKDLSNNTALHYAAQCGVKRFIETLLPYCSFDDRNNSGETPFDLAKAAQKADVFVNALFSKARCVLITDNRLDISPLLKQLLLILETNYGKEHVKVAECWNLIGKNCYRQMRYAEALEALNKARQNPDVVPFLRMIGECYYETEEYRKAIEVLESLGIRYDLSEGSAKYQYIIGQCYQKIGDTGKAKEWFSRAKNYHEREFWYQHRVLFK